MNELSSLQRTVSYAESIQPKIQKVKRTALGYRNRDSFEADH